MNKPTKIFNNIGFYCSLIDNIFIPNNNIAGYTSLDYSAVGYFVPYLIRNQKDGYKWEIGVGEIQYRDGSVVIKRNIVSSSSNNNNAVNFTSNQNEFYLFVNNNNFNTAFNNVILKTDHFTIDGVSAIYLVDTSQKNIDCVLSDPSKSRNLCIDIKSLYNDHNTIIRDSAGQIITSGYTLVRLACDGDKWHIIEQSDSGTVDNFASLQSSEFSAQGDPAGNAYSFQYNDGANALAGSQIYWSSGDTNKLLLGSSSESTAHSVIPASGSASVLFNKDYQASDFIIYGSGQPHRNLFFSYDGRVGINIPSGSRPQTIFHVVNYSCSEIIRLENRTSCQPAKFTIYHKPTASLSDGSVCSIINLAGKDSNNNQKDYANISSIASSTSSGFGALNLSVSSGNNQISIMSGSVNNIILGYDANKSININNNGNIVLSGSVINTRAQNSLTIGTNNTNISFNTNSNSIIFTHGSTNFGSGSVSISGPLSANSLAVNSLSLPNIAPSSLLTVSNTNTIMPVSGISISSGNLVLRNISGNKFLTSDTNNNLVGVFDIDDFFKSDKDIIWSKYDARPASVCLKQVTFDSVIPLDEFVIGDQIEIKDGDNLIYRTITSIVSSDQGITELLLDQNVTTNTIDNILVSSITRGGVLSIGRATNGTISQSSSNILSSRPFIDTVFNTNQQDINFTIYGSHSTPAFKVYSNNGLITQYSGSYYNYATQNNSIESMIINSVGSGLTNNFSTANYNYNISNNLFSGVLSSVGSNGSASSYGTYDQNGNVAEWLESDVEDGRLVTEFAAGGSYKTPVTGINNVLTSKYLKSIEQLSVGSGYDHVGFRVASIINLADNNRITNPNILNFSFINITDTNNIADTGSFYIQNNNTFTEDSRSDLGVVNKAYRLSLYEVTNFQYSQFLNSVATGVSDSYSNILFNSSMSGSLLGGINRESNGLVYSYAAKPNMANKPINYVSYINSLRFINWMHHNAPSGSSLTSIEDTINNGAYTILQAGSSYYVTTNKNKKYFLPSLNQWHKAAYFKLDPLSSSSGFPIVTIGSSEPYIVAREKTNTNSTEPPKQLLANLTVSGWLVVDKIIVRDGTINSPLSDLGFDPEINADTGTDEIVIQTDAGSQTPPLFNANNGSSSSLYWSNATSIRWGGGAGVFGQRVPPLPPDGNGQNINCEDSELIVNNNIPYWCAEYGRNRGPSFY